MAISPRPVLHIHLVALVSWLMVTDMAVAEELVLNHVGLKLCRQSEVPAQEAGPLLEVLVHEGQRVTIGTLLGSLLPLLFQRIGLDPAVTSTPFVASLVDVMGIILYFEIARRLLLT